MTFDFPGMEHGSFSDPAERAPAEPAESSGEISELQKELERVQSILAKLDEQLWDIEDLHQTLVSLGESGSPTLGDIPEGALNENAKAAVKLVLDYRAVREEMANILDEYAEVVSRLKTLKAELGMSGEDVNERALEGHRKFLGTLGTGASN